MNPTFLELIATGVFAIAVVHTFSIKRFQHWALAYPSGSVGENLFHLLGEVEIVFGLWAAVLVAVIGSVSGGTTAIDFVESRNFTEPVFVFVIMTIAATRPILRLADTLIAQVARLILLPRVAAFFVSTLVVGPVLGSVITEPAAMTVTALILKRAYLDKNVSDRFRYVTLAVLFVNVSIGGVLTHFAAPPVLMVAGMWNWGARFMFIHFGWKAVVAVVCNALIAMLLLRKELKTVVYQEVQLPDRLPWWLTSIHLVFLGLVVVTNHHPIFFLGLFLFFIGVTIITKEYQDELKLKESLLVGFFLGGLVVLGGPQGWWLKPVLASLGESSLFFGATLLTAFMDNAALTFLGAQVHDIHEALKFALVAGAVSGGGLTVIANAPNPAGFAILKSSFGEEGISPVTLFATALWPTAIAMGCLWLFPF